MRIRPAVLDSSPDRPGRARLTAEVAYDDAPRSPERYWIEVDDADADSLSRSGSPWLVWLLPLAAARGEPIRLECPVDPVLRAGADELQRLWAIWYPACRVVSIEADEEPAAAGVNGSRRAAFFSGGVDSYYTLLEHVRLAAERPSQDIDDLLTVWGFDLPLSDPDAFERLHCALYPIAEALGKRLVTAATNLRDTRWRETDWGKMAHGPALGGVALFFEPRYEQVLVASSYSYRHLIPWGSHPLTDPLMSTSRLRMVHDGAALTRADKMRVVAKSELALRSLHVCWRSRSDRNCGACGKCYRAMALLSALGVLERCSTFPPGAFDVRRLPRVYAGAAQRASNVATHDLALEYGRVDIARAYARSYRFSMRVERFERWLTALSHTPLLWRAEPAARRILLRDVIR